MSSIYDTSSWVDTWAAAIVAEPASRETIAARLKDLLAGKSIGGVPGILASQKPKDMLSQFVRTAQWDFKPAALDDVWHAVFDIAKGHGWTEHFRDETYYWTEQYLLNVAWDALSDDEDSDEGGEEYDNSWITCAMGAARLFSLGYGYSAFAWNALLDGLGLGGEERNSDSMRIGACAQLLGAGRRIKLHLLGGGEERHTPGFAGRHLDAQPKEKRADWEKNGAETWANFLKMLVDEQQRAGSRAAALLKASFVELFKS
ncbi:unnamed protein product [Cyclocybe aegerita]|uniref:Uncharacterized protein n=1 Tax=Cyclocybe aegerita TaxID=1973307 RepID=A0A8S0WYV5_CYCAE|nr:unnamed protein product [Cyclocybe aegerita]